PPCSGRRSPSAPRRERQIRAWHDDPTRAIVLASGSWRTSASKRITKTRNQEINFGIASEARSSTDTKSWTLQHRLNLGAGDPREIAGDRVLDGAGGNPIIQPFL